MENSTTWFVFLGQRKTGVGAARRPTRVSVRRNPTRVHVCACVCVCTRRSLSPSPGWFREEVPKSPPPPSFSGAGARRPQAERPADGTGSEGGSLQMHTLNFGSLSSCCCSQLAQLSWHPASTAGTGPAVLVARSTQGRAQHLSQCPAAFWSCVTSGILLWRLG